MRWVSVPEELAPPYLLELAYSPPSLQDQFSQVLSAVAQGDLAVAADATLRAFRLAKAQRHRQGSALALVLRADVLRRLMRWEDSLDAIRNALHGLELDVSPVAHYNEAIAVYLEGVVHYTLRADEKALATFAYAQSALRESERHWAFEHNTARTSDCRNVIRWLTQLSAFQDPEETTDPVVMVMPVYEMANRTLIRTGAVALPPIELVIPREVVARYCPPGTLPLQLEALTFPSLRPDIQYAAIRIADTASIAGEVPFADVGKGDLLILEVTGSGPGSRDLVLTADQPFVRGSDGRVAFHPAPQGFSTGASGEVPALVGIPRVLIRSVEAQ
ncbi:MAG: hypothetical protein JXC32_13215 [Anaerolineae bacterium]|nr:hypothetical protein [Anaerolineae bacterium]